MSHTLGLTETLLPPIDPRPLTRAQRAGRRCAVPNCRRPGPDRPVGVLPGGRLAWVCGDCAVVLEVAA